MQKKIILPVAVLSLAMLATACSPYGTNNQGMSPTRQGYTNNYGYNTTGTTYGTDYARVTNNATSPFYGNTTTNRGYNDQLNNFNRTSTNNFGTTLGDLRDTNPNVRTTNVTAQANKIAKMANGVRGVDSAKTLIVGNTAYVGLDIDSRVSRRNSGRIEQEVHRVVSKVLPGYDIRVTSDRALFQRTGTFFNNDQNNFNMWNRTPGSMSP